MFGYYFHSNIKIFSSNLLRMTCVLQSLSRYTLQEQDTTERSKPNYSSAGVDKAMAQMQGYVLQIYPRGLHRCCFNISINPPPSDKQISIGSSRNRYSKQDTKMMHIIMSRWGALSVFHGGSRGNPATASPSTLAHWLSDQWSVLSELTRGSAFLHSYIFLCHVGLKCSSRKKNLFLDRGPAFNLSTFLVLHFLH